MAQDIINKMNSYTEYSPSGTGIRIIFKAPNFEYDKDRYYINNKSRGLEVYIAGCTNKYVTLTGNVISETVIRDCTEEIKAILELYMKRPKTEEKAVHSSYNLSDDEIIVKACKAKNGGTFKRLWSGDISEYSSQSEADLALCNILAFWTNKRFSQIDRLFRKSSLMRRKWDRKQSGSTYGKDTINKAIRFCSNVYQPSDNALNSNGDIKLFSMKPDSYDWTDIGNGRIFADYYKDTVRFVIERGKWAVYDGSRWVVDDRNLKVMELCKALANKLIIYATSIEDEHRKTKFIEHASKWQTRNRRETIIKDAQSVYPVSQMEFDSNPRLFNCINGTLDLTTYKFHEHNPEDMLTKMAGVKYNPDIKSERWIKFVDEVMQGDKEKTDFFQRALGYALTGDTQYECFFILYGKETRNGKGTAMETFMKLMGEYGKTSNPETIALKQANSRAPSEDIARLAGARFVNMSEPDKKLSLNTALVKTLTGRDTINARFLNENSFDFVP